MESTNQPQMQPQAPGVTRIQDFASHSTASHPPNPLHLSTDEAFDLDNAEATDEMGQLSRNGSRGQLPTRPDWSDVLNIEQTKQLQHLINSIADGMNDEYKELWATMADASEVTDPRITGPAPMMAQFVSIPNPNSAKYAHLFGNKPLYPEGEGPKNGAAIDGDSKTNVTSEKATAKPKPKFGRPVAPTLPPGMDTDDIKTINAGNRPKAGNPTAYTLPPGITASMLPLKMPKTFREAADMYGQKTREEKLRNELIELKRDNLAHFGKFRAAVAKRMDIIIIRRGGNAGNVNIPQNYLEPRGTKTGAGQQAGGRPHQQQSLPVRPSAISQPQNGAGVCKYPNSVVGYQRKSTIPFIYSMDLHPSYPCDTAVTCFPSGSLTTVSQCAYDTSVYMRV